MPLTSGADHVGIDNFHAARGALSYYVLGNTVQFRARNGDTFYVSYQNLQNPLTGNPFGSLAEFIAWLDMNTFS